MRRVDQVVSLLESQAGSAIRAGNPADDALLELLVHMASSDGVFDDAEIAMLERVLPSWNPTQIRAFIGKVEGSRLDLERLAAALSTEDHKWTALRFAARMAMKDEHLDPHEEAFLGSLSTQLDLPAGALERVLREVAGPPAERLGVEGLRTIINQYQWAAADFVDGPVQSRDLIPVVPQGSTPIVRIGVDQAEIMGLYAEGLVARFLEGAAFLRWRDIVGCTRGVGLESSVRLHTEDGRIWSLIDARMGGIQFLIDRLYRPDKPHRPASAPTILGPATNDDTWDEEPD